MKEKHQKIKGDYLNLFSNELMMSEDQYKKIFGEVFTPAILVNEMLDKLPEEIWKNKDLKWVDPACGSGNFLYQVKLRLMENLTEIEDEREREKWIVEEMLYGVELQRKNTYLCMFKLDPNDEFETNVVCEDSLKFDFWRMKFDVVVGNPPYNSSKSAGGGMRTGRGGVLWPEFINLAFNLLKPNGYLTYIHPSRWRKPDDNLWRQLKSKYFLYLEIHNAKDGMKIFNANTRYDWYVLKNTEITSSQNTQILDEYGKSYNINFSTFPFLPNGHYNEFKKMIAENGENKYNILYTTAYHNNKPYVKRSKEPGYEKPCVNSTVKSGIVYFYTDTFNRSEIPKTPKIIVGETGFDCPVIDSVGEYATTEASYGFPLIQNTKNEIESILEDIKCFNKFKSSFLWLGYRIEYKIFNYFKKDFYKEFLDD